VPVRSLQQAVESLLPVPYGRSRCQSVARSAHGHRSIVRPRTCLGSNPCGQFDGVLAPRGLPRVARSEEARKVRGGPSTRAFRARLPNGCQSRPIGRRSEASGR
jgi:hypothetical protein